MNGLSNIQEYGRSYVIQMERKLLPESFKMAYDMLVKKSLFYLIPVLFATHPGEESLEMAKNLCTADSAAREIRKNGMGALVKCMREYLE